MVSVIVQLVFAYMCISLARVWEAHVLAINTIEHLQAKSVRAAVRFHQLVMIKLKC